MCTEAGLFAIRAGRDYVLEEDFMKASRKLMDAKKLEGKLEYSKYVEREGGKGEREGERVYVFFLFKIYRALSPPYLFIFIALPSPYALSPPYNRV